MAEMKTIDHKTIVYKILLTLITMLAVLGIGVIIAGGVSLFIGIMVGTIPANMITISGMLLFFAVGGISSVLYSNFICRGNCFKSRD